jgi:hypothetical protein
MSSLVVSMGVRRMAAGRLATTTVTKSSAMTPSVWIGSSSSSTTALRWKSGDAGDVIGIDLGTTNSCVAIMVGHVFSGCRRRRFRRE